MLRRNLLKVWSIVLLLCLIGTNIIALADDTDYLFDNNTSGAETKNGARSIIYISAEEMELPEGSDGLFLAVGSGIYTSIDGIKWTARDKGNCGWELEYETYYVSDQVDVRQNVAYGGQTGDKKALITRGYYTNKLICTSQYLSNPKEVNVVDTEGNKLFITCIVWDSYTKKFWAGANVYDSEFKSAGAIYYSDGTVSDDTITWTKVDLGDADLFAGETTNYSYKLYSYINTNNNGTFAFGAKFITRWKAQEKIGDENRYRFGAFITDENIAAIDSKVITLSAGTVIKGDSTDYTLDASYTPRDVIVDDLGRFIIAPHKFRSGTWYRMIICDISGDTPEYTWIRTRSDSDKNAAGMSILAQNKNGIVALAGYYDTVRTTTPTLAALTWAPYDENSKEYTAEHLVSADSDGTNKVFGTDNSDFTVWSSSAAISPDNTVVIAQTVKTSGDTPQYYGRLVTVKQTDAGWGEPIITIEEDSDNNYGIIRVSDMSMVPGQSKQLSATIVNTINSSSRQAGADDIKVVPINLAPELTISETGTVSLSETAASSQKYTADIMVINAQRPSVFAVFTVNVTGINEKSIVINDVEDGKFQAGDNVIKAKYNAEVINDYDALFVCIAAYHRGVLVDVSAGHYSVKAGETVPETELILNIPEEEFGEYTVKAFFWKSASSMTPV